MDLTLTYFLTKAHLASLALEPEFDVSSSIAKAASQDVNLLQAQSKIVNMAKNNALSAMHLASSQVGFRERLVYLPGYYHFVSWHFSKGKYSIADAFFVSAPGALCWILVTADTAQESVLACRRSQR